MNKNKAFLLFVLSIFPATFCLGWINEITLKTGLQKILVFCYLEVIFILLIYMIAKGFGTVFNQNNIVIRNIIIGMAIFLTIIFADSCMPKIYCEQQVAISISDEADADSCGKEVWIQQVSLGDKLVDLEQLDLSNTGWIYSNGLLYGSGENEDSLLILPLKKHEKIDIVFGKHGWSGIVNLNFENRVYAYNLYSKNPDSVRVILQPHGSMYQKGMYAVMISGFFVLCLLLEGFAAVLIKKIRPDLSEKEFFLLCMIVASLFMPMRKVNVVIEPLDSKAIESKGNEIWILEIDGQSVEVAENVHLEEGWQIKSGNIAYIGDSGKSITISLQNKKPEIVFGMHGWSGRLKIHNGFSTKTVDLYSVEGDRYIYNPDGIVSLSSVIWGGILLIIVIWICYVFRFRSKLLNRVFEPLKYILCFVMYYLFSMFVFDISLLLYWLVFLFVSVLSYCILAKRSHAILINISLPMALFLIFESISNIDCTQLAESAVFLNLLILSVISAIIVNALCLKNIGVYFLLILAFVLSTVNHFVIQFKQYALIPADIFQIETAAAVAGNYQYQVDEKILIGVFLAVLFAYLTFSSNNHSIAIEKSVIIKREIVATVFMVTLITGFYTIDFKEINVIREDRDDNWQNMDYYSQNGFVASFIKYWQDMKINKPEEYSVSYAESILSRYSQSDMNRVEEEKPIIIGIMNESFSDLQDWLEMGNSEESLTFYKELESSLEKGDTYVSVLGGGTCNSEFEFLTGSSMEMFSAVYPYTTFDFGKVESVVTSLKEQGYKAIAMHPASPKNYKRDRVYSALGFDQFYSYDDYENSEKMIYDQTSDQADYEKILEIIEQAEEPLFIFNVTMQNHGPYIAEELKKEVPFVKLDKKFEAFDDLKLFSTLMKESDQALKFFLEELEMIDKKVIICMFGDHQPGALDQAIEQFYKLPTAESEIEQIQFRYKTPYLIWANYSVEAIETTQLDEMKSSPNFLSTSLLAYAGVRQTPYQLFINDMHKHILASNRFGYLGDNGIWYSYDDDMSPYRTWIQDYRILQYYQMFDHSR